MTWHSAGEGPQRMLRACGMNVVKSRPRAEDKGQRNRQSKQLYRSGEGQIEGRDVAYTGRLRKEGEEGK
jgi:hypothetical protein